MSRLALVALPLAVACAGAGPDPVLDGWLGDERHFRALGTLAGEDVDLDVVDATCALEWEAPSVDGVADPAAGVMTEIRVGGATADRLFEFELKRHDFQRDPPGLALTVIPRDDGAAPRSDEAWVEWEWYTLAGADVYEQAAVSGAIALGLLTGTLDETGLVFVPGTGVAGGFVEARWSPTEHLAVSFTAPCESSLLELLEQ